MSDRRGIKVWIGALGLCLGVSAATQAGLFSRTYQFKQNVTLEVGTATADGLRIDTIRFDFPQDVGGKLVRTSGPVRAEVTLSNVATVARKVGIALALFDPEGRLVGVASGGNRVAALKPGRQQTYSLTFDGVNAEAFKAEKFQVSVETK